MAEMIRKGGIQYSVDKVRDPGFENETRDCFVRAVQAVTGVPYRDAHAFVATKFERQTRKGTYNVEDRMQKIVSEAATIFGYRVFDKPVPTRRTVRRSRFQYVQAVVYPTLEQMMLCTRQGRYVMVSCNHAWTVIDGVVHDNGLTGNRRVTHIWEFKASSECEGK